MVCRIFYFNLFRVYRELYLLSGKCQIDRTPIFNFAMNTLLSSSVRYRCLGVHLLDEHLPDIIRDIIGRQVSTR